MVKSTVCFVASTFTFKKRKFIAKVWKQDFKLIGTQCFAGTLSILSQLDLYSCVQMKVTISWLEPGQVQS